MKTFRLCWGFGVGLPACFFGLLLLSTSGCGGGGGPELGDVSGTVTLDGQPLANASVTFSPAQGRGSDATTDAQGRYRLRFTAQEYGVVLGDHTVRITTAGVSDPETGESIEPTVTVPAKYNTETELTAKVEGGKETINFPLTSQ